MGAKDQHCEESSADTTHTALLDFVRLFVFCFFALKTFDNASGLFEFKSNQIRFLSSITRGVVAPSPEPEAHVLSVRAFELSSFPLALNFENDPSEKMTPKILTILTIIII